MSYNADSKRYDGAMKYRRCGKSGILLPEVSLGLWHNFGSGDSFKNAREMLFTAFDLGITHFDLANNYGPPPGSAESTLGQIIKRDLRPYRNEMLISTKAGYTMWEGVYGDWGSRKYLISSLDDSLQRLGLDYVDIFYHHRPDPHTPLEETMAALDHIVRQGKALYVGLSNYSAAQFKEATEILNKLGTPCLIEQSKYSMMVRTPEDGLLETVRDGGTGFIAFSPLAQGLLTNKYMGGVPRNSRAKLNRFLKESDITPQKMEVITKLNQIAESLNISLAQLAVKWLLRDDDQRVTSVLIGASSAEQIRELAAVSAIQNIDQQILGEIDNILSTL